MQTFLPYSDFAQSAAVLDTKRLGKQRLEAYQILRTLLGLSQGWKNHPVVRMWKGHDGALGEYGLAMCGEWKDRGYKDSLYEKISSYLVKTRNDLRPRWVYSPAFLRSHRSNLLRKNPSHYRKFWPKLSDNLPYVWPVK